MKRDETDVSHLMGWFVACVVVACVLIGLSLSELPGGKRIGQFVYDYQTLITGFLAAGAAFVTVHFLRRQIDVAQLQARDTFSITLKRSRALAIKAKLHAITMNSLARWEFFTPQSLATEAGWNFFVRDLRELRGLAEDPILDAVESEIAYPPGFGIEYVRNLIEVFMKEQSHHLEVTDTFDDERGYAVYWEWRSVGRATNDYCGEFIKVCDDFLSETKTILARYE